MGVMAQLADQCAQGPRRVADAESLRWLSDLSDTGPGREDAAERLHALLLRAARFEVARRQRAGCSAVDGDDLAVQAADDALVPLEADGWAQLHDHGRACPDAEAEAFEVIGAVRDAITEVLTPQQRAVLVALTLNDVPIDVLAERRDTTRGALYKTLHDARRKLRARLAQDGFAIEGRAA
jgi:RNA polymerase sigma-70 factor (ECF subfamily)